MAWFVELPSNTQLAIGGIVLAAFNLLIQYVLAYVPWLAEFVGKYKGEWASALTVALLSWLQNVLPGGEYADVSVLGVQLVVAIVLVVLAKYGLRRAGVRAFQ
jgi:hypothetical protein